MFPPLGHTRKHWGHTQCSIPLCLHDGLCMPRWGAPCIFCKCDQARVCVCVYVFVFVFVFVCVCVCVCVCLCVWKYRVKYLTVHFVVLAVYSSCSDYECRTQINASTPLQYAGVHLLFDHAYATACIVSAIVHVLSQVVWVWLEDSSRGRTTQTCRVPRSLWLRPLFPPFTDLRAVNINKDGDTPGDQHLAYVQIRMEKAANADHSGPDHSLSSNHSTISHAEESAIFCPRTSS